MIKLNMYRECIENILNDYEKYPIRIQEYWNSYGTISYRKETPVERLERVIFSLKNCLDN